MSEHEIRLRAAWEAVAPGPAGEVRRRLDLPLPGPPGPDGPLRLRRAFRHPPLDPDRERLALRLADVPGLRAVRLDDRVLWTAAAGADPPPEPELELEVPLPDLPSARHMLELDVEARAAPGPARPWGRVRLVILAAGPAPDGGEPGGASL